MAFDLGVLVGGPAHEAHLHESDAAAVGHVVLVAFVLQGDEADAEGVQSAFVHQGYGVAAQLGVGDSGGDVEAVVAVLCRGDGPDQLVVLVAELGGVGVVENGVTVERLRALPRVVVDVSEGHGHALDGASVAFRGLAEAEPPVGDFPVLCHSCASKSVDGAGVCDAGSGGRPSMPRASSTVSTPHAMRIW